MKAALEQILYALAPDTTITYSEVIVCQVYNKENYKLNITCGFTGDNLMQANIETPIGATITLFRSQKISHAKEVISLLKNNYFVMEHFSNELSSFITNLDFSSMSNQELADFILANNERVSNMLSCYQKKDLPNQHQEFLIGLAKETLEFEAVSNFHYTPNRSS
ncbi:hypothetical protein V6R21_17790 [Limibacter armeniacum]|uniref:hypothetical protein n=1 Tax=Limibacter armeniacum TaxID=466084 RepID=UPI002FE59160